MTFSFSRLLSHKRWQRKHLEIYSFFKEDRERVRAAMSEEAVRLTRSQKRALEKDGGAPPDPLDDVDAKRVKLEKGDEAEAPPDPAGPGAAAEDAEGAAPASEHAATVAAGVATTGEVKATVKVEVQTGDEPVDMSTSKSDIKSERQPPSPDDVIVLSDNEPSSPLMNGHCLSKTDTDKLMEELRLQEAKLVLLKKLRQSQIQKESVQKVIGRSSGTVIPPPLVRGGQHMPPKHTSQIVMPPLVRGAQPIAVTPQQIASLRLQQHQHSGSGPPPLLLAPRASVPNVQIQGQRIIQQGLIRVANVANSNLMVNIPQASPTSLKGSSVSPNSNINDSPASRQAAAKLALRKQLEKTLLEIPPPKPPAPEFNFLPSAANNEFIYLLGLEEVVQKLLEMHGREPYTCAQCKTDFTSRWRKEKPGTILCDQCMSSNQKKALKAEHTNRLKAAFVKALQQEQEIEQRILQQAASSASSSSSLSKSTSSPSLSKSEVLVSQQYKHVRAAMQHRAVSAHHSHKQSHMSHNIQSMSSRGLAHSFTSSSQLQSAMAAAAALGSRAGKHAAARPLQHGAKVSAGSSSNQSNVAAWRKQTGGNAGVTMAYVNPSLSAHNKTTSAVERQREYLLDMIPSRSISQAANTWK
ncbi:Transcriptional repressor p66-alpha [Liparis tanakae]|uniref:Transcriptional repressor p66-alpha n=1 Tax=Liparis tanakae TaxID=230148 RepID=A0A4Z2F761_9TELE|nr:Transcriptional repressor p66-alpha [Liparis tanakae]